MKFALRSPFGVSFKPDDMKLKNYSSILFAALLFSSSVAFAQDSTHHGATAKPIASAATTTQPIASRPPVDQSLQGQYQEMLMRSRSQEGYKLVNPYRLTTLWKNTMDTLSKERKLRKEAQGKLNGSASSIQAMTDSLAKNQTALEHSLTEINSIYILGMPVAKTAYNTIMWGLVILLAVAVAVIAAMMGKYKHEASYRIKLFEELQEEFQTYKSKANEREKKLARELQDERNKLDDLLNGNK